VSEAVQQSFVEAAGTILAALLGAIAAVMTWYLSTRGERQRERMDRQAAAAEEAAARDQRVIDIVTAIHAEIFAGIGSASSQATPRERRYALDDDNPFATPDETDVVFRSILAELTILPVDVLHEVVVYYRLARQSSLLTADLRHPDFIRQPPDAKRKFIKGLLAVNGRQLSAGLAALSAIEGFATPRGIDLAAKRGGTVQPPTGGRSSDDRDDRTSGHAPSPSQ
jgi:hypothetical protein